MNSTHLEEQTTSGGGLASDDMSVSNDGQVLHLGSCRYAKQLSQFGVKLVDDQGVTLSSFERLAAVVVLSSGIICLGGNFPSAGTKMRAGPARDVRAIMFLMRSPWSEVSPMV